GQWLRDGELPMPDAIAADIRGAGFSAVERSTLADAVRKRLVSDRALSSRGTFLWRHHLAIAFDALGPDSTAPAAARSQLIAMLGDARRMHEGDQIASAILLLRPTPAERKTIIPLMIAIITGVTEAWQLVGLTKSLLSVKLVPQQKTQVREALFAAIE